MKITMHGNPLTLVGTPIKTGETAPVFYGINLVLFRFNLLFGKNLPEKLL